MFGYSRIADEELAVLIHQAHSANALRNQNRKDIIQLRKSVQHQLKVMIDYGRYATDSPDAPRMLVHWQQNFSQSLASYRTLHAMSPAEWSTLSVSDLIDLADMLFTAYMGLMGCLLTPHAITAAQ